jgi:hypothetical protein
MNQIHLTQNRVQLQASIFNEHEKNCLLFKISILRGFASHAHGILPSAAVIAFCVDNNMLYIVVESTCDLHLRDYNGSFDWVSHRFTHSLSVLSDANTHRTDGH